MLQVFSHSLTKILIRYYENVRVVRDIARIFFFFFTYSPSYFITFKMEINNQIQNHEYFYKGECIKQYLALVTQFERKRESSPSLHREIIRT